MRRKCKIFNEIFSDIGKDHAAAAEESNQGLSCLPKLFPNSCLLLIIFVILVLTKIRSGPDIVLGLI